VVIHRWALATRNLAGPPILIDIASLAGPIGASGFEPSGIERHRETGTYLLIAGPQAAIAEVSVEGRVLAVSRLDAERHPQPEGVAIGLDGRLLIADEDRDNGGRLAQYAPRRSARSGDPP
jgi:hypothetical protein